MYTLVYIQYASCEYEYHYHLTEDVTRGSISKFEKDINIPMLPIYLVKYCE